jgi:hypothetical protein
MPKPYLILLVATRLPSRSRQSVSSCGSQPTRSTGSRAPTLNRAIGATRVREVRGG